MSDERNSDAPHGADDASRPQIRKHERAAYGALLIDSLSDAVISAGLDYTIKSWNKAAERIHGWTKDEAIGRRIDHLVKTRFPSSTPSEVWQQLQDSDCVEVEVAHLHKNGREVQLRASVNLIRNADGTPTDVVAVLHDITAHKRAEEQALRKNAVLKGINTILEAALNCETEEEVGQICLTVAQEITGSTIGFIGETGTDCQFQTIAISAMGWEMCSIRDVSGQRKPPERFSARGLYGRVLKEGRSLLSNSPSEHPDSIGVPAGHPALTSFLGTPLVLGDRTVGMVAVANNPNGYGDDELECLEALAPAIIEGLHRKRAEIAIRESEKQNAFLARTLELSSQAFNIGYPDGRLGLVNRAFELLTGYSAEELKSISWREALTPPEWLLMEDLKLEEINRTGQPIRYEKEYIRKDGTRVPIELLVHVARDSEGKPLYYYSFVNDISERKRSQKAMIRSEKLASLGRMAATIAHEINNPLAAVTNALFLAQSSLDDPFSLRLYLQMADEELKRVAHITRQALGFYREMAAPAEVAVPELVESVLDLLKSRIVASGASIECQYESGVSVKCVGGEIRQVLSNLLSNSLDAITERREAGVIKLRVAKGKSIHTGRHHVRVTVADNGRGLDRAAKAHIFEPFFTTKESRGTGLGLWVCKQLIDKHGGAIHLRSYTRGQRQGTTFSFTLPI